MYVYMYVYIYIYRERERHIHIHTHTHTHTRTPPCPRRPAGRAPGGTRGRGSPRGASAPPARHVYRNSSNSSHTSSIIEAIE